MTAKYSIALDRQRDDLWAARPSTVLARMAQENPDFLPLTIAPMDPQRPLMVIIHPGDMVETDAGWGEPKAAATVQAFWSHNGLGLRSEMAKARKEGYDIVVVHRESSVEFFSGSRRHSLARRLWTEHFCPLFSQASTFWADNLDAVVAWLCGNTNPQTRPSIHLAGAYACPQTGCVTAVGKGLLAAGVESARLSVSPFSPPSNGPGLVWRPHGVVAMSIPESLAAQYAALA